MKNNKREILLVTLAGAAIGAGLGILYAPNKGKKTRKKIKNAVEDTSGDVSDWLTNTKNDLTKSAHKKGEEIEKKVKSSLS